MTQQSNEQSAFGQSLIDGLMEVFDLTGPVFTQEETP